LLLTCPYGYKSQVLVRALLYTLETDDVA